MEFIVSRHYLRLMRFATDLPGLSPCRLGCNALHAEVQRLRFICEWLAWIGWKLDVCAHCSAEVPSGLTYILYSVTASITFGGSQLVLAAITLWNDTYVPTGTCLHLQTVHFLLESIPTFSLANCFDILGCARHQRSCKHLYEQVGRSSLTAGILH